MSAKAKISLCVLLATVTMFAMENHPGLKDKSPREIRRTILALPEVQGKTVEELRDKAQEDFERHKKEQLDTPITIENDCCKFELAALFVLANIIDDEILRMLIDETVANREETRQALAAVQGHIKAVRGY